MIYIYDRYVDVLINIYEVSSDFDILIIASFHLIDNICQPCLHKNTLFFYSLFFYIWSI